MAIEAESEGDKYDTHTAVICYMCGGGEVERTAGNVSPFSSNLGPCRDATANSSDKAARGGRWSDECYDICQTDRGSGMGAGNDALRAYTVSPTGSSKEA